MEFALTTVLGLIIGSLICEFIDSSLGMMYGTILSPVLIIAGFNPLLVVPSILFSQALGGFIAAILHHRLKNVDFTLKSKDPTHIKERLSQLGYREGFNRGLTKDLKVTFCIAGLGIIATILAALVAVNIPKVVLKTYIGILVLAMGIILLSKTNFKFSWKKIIGIGALSAFNKGISGGGFGPIVTSGQMISGRDGKSSIGSTALAETPVCIVGFLTYFFTKGISDWRFLLLLTIGSIIGAVIGPHFTAKIRSEKKLKKGLGILVITLGVWTLTRAWLI
ncbi:sulfite exporter TauE/SafE family protein [bacterium]|nr:sulfite exporter TauE/SafE family protein [bacterium]